MNEAQRSAALVREEAARLDAVNNSRLEVLRVEIAKLELKADDKLLVTVPLGTSNTQMHLINEGLTRLFGSSHRHIVRTENIGVSIISQADLEDETRV
jgi:thiazole synthase ThiGH ThiG subunit